MNRLAAEASAYLTSAAHQPVHWYAWTEEAFAAARAENKPILLDIGAVWCHWCHVMDGESYEDPDLAAYLAEHFVCIKVDRDERPDVDARYQRAVQALTGQGGWPLTAFLTSDGDVFSGGTYFPPEGKYGRPGFRTVLERVRALYAEQRDKVAATARELRDHVAATLSEAARGELSPALLAQAADRMARLFDFRHGGFGSEPKFPHPAAILFLLARWWDTGETWLREMVERTLTGMAEGGIHDQLGGGFHRYSVDERWRVPHFEKMSYDHSELLKAYVHAYAALGTPLYREVAEGIVAWALEVLAVPERGGFAASQDADVGPEDDGDYFTWTQDEARAALTAEEWEAARRRWDIYPDGEMHHDPRKNVLWVARTIEALAEELQVPELQVRTLLESARAKLLAARRRRPAPFVDRAIYVGWNAMMCEAFLEAGAVLDRDDCVRFALESLGRLWAEAFRPGEGMGHRAGSDGLPALLDDQVQAASAAITAYEHTGEQVWLDRAQELAGVIVSRFKDPGGGGGGGGFLDTTARGAGFLDVRAKPIQDAPTPSPNAVAALVLLRLHALSGDGSYRAEAERALEAFAGSAGELGLQAGSYYRALDWLLSGECRIVVAEATTNGPLASAALCAYRPRKAVLREAPSPSAGVGAPRALVCAGTACAAPVGTPSELRETLERFGRAR
ncbi:MAG: thioredoxin domain-containing protein [Gemmatimonadetes bacterium]|nr:thioredoxin domain-containing protein [Gemmatimonadota bacterium]